MVIAASWTEVMSAWGTVGAVVGAVGLALAPLVRRRLTEPKLAVVTGVTEPFGVAPDRRHRSEGMATAGRHLEHGQVNSYRPVRATAALVGA